MNLFVFTWRCIMNFRIISDILKKRYGKVLLRGFGKDEIEEIDK